MGIYVGRSPFHAGSVALVLNPRTGHVSPQYHVVFDDDFTTVPYLNSMDVPAHWAALVKSSSESATDEDYSLAETWFNQSPDANSSQEPSTEVSLSDSPPSSLPLLSTYKDVADSEGGSTASAVADTPEPASSPVDDSPIPPLEGVLTDHSAPVANSDPNNFVHLETTDL